MTRIDRSALEGLVDGVERLGVLEGVSFGVEILVAGDMSGRFNWRLTANSAAAGFALAGAAYLNGSWFAGHEVATVLGRALSGSVEACVNGAGLGDRSVALERAGRLVRAFGVAGAVRRAPVLFTSARMAGFRGACSECGCLIFDTDHGCPVCGLEAVTPAAELPATV